MFEPEITTELNRHRFSLTKEKGVFWHEQQALLLADVHAGKATHFRKYGIPLSSDLLLNDLNAIEDLVARFNAKKVIVLGDLFHSDLNIENQFVEKWVDDLDVSFELIVGNHDIHSISSSAVSYTPDYVLDGFHLSHEPLETNHFNIFGHLHPAFTLTGKGRQHIKLPSYYISSNFMVLPSFGSTTGKRTYKELIKHSEVYITSDEGVAKIKSL